MAKIVTAPLVVAYNSDGSHRYLYEGAELPSEGLQDGEEKRLQEGGFLDDKSESDDGVGADAKPSRRR